MSRSSNFSGLFDIVSGSPIFSVVLWHRLQIPYLFSDSLASFSKSLKDMGSISSSSTSCLDHLSFRQLSRIVLGFPISSMLFCIVFRSPVFSAALQHHVQIPYRFGDSPVSCLDSLSFGALLHRVSIPYLFDGSPTSCLDPLSIGGSLASCLDLLSFRWLSSNVLGSRIFSTAL